MNQETVQALHRINRDFYRRCAAEFSASRRRPWPGWERALAAYRGRRDPSRPGRILDLGCGNGRLGDYLAPDLGVDHSYLGVDRSPRLLADAAGAVGRFRAGCLAAADLLTTPWPLPSTPRFSWVAAFGVLHHVAGRHNRRRFMAQLGRRVAPGGVATVSFWQFAGQPRFRRRRAEWRGVDRSQLEDGDWLLRWGSGDAVRYCHHVDDDEADELAAASGLERLSAYRSDGEGKALNLYLLLARGRPPATAAGGGG